MSPAPRAGVVMDTPSQAIVPLLDNNKSSISGRSAVLGTAPAGTATGSGGHQRLSTSSIALISSGIDLQPLPPLGTSLW